MIKDRFLHRFSIGHRFRLGGVHFGLSLMVAMAAAAIVFGIWYPGPYRTLSGGLHLFSILMVVDMMLGPLATAVVSRPDKSRREWRVDVALIVAVQLVALSYGLWTMYQARPVYLAFEIDRMRVVHAIDVSPDLLAIAPTEFQTLPLNGPGLIAVRPFASETEKAEMTMAALQGVELGFRPDLWVPYVQEISRVSLASAPLTELMKNYPAWRPTLLAAVEKEGLSIESVRYLPMHARTAFWTVLLDGSSMMPLAYVPLDPYTP